MTCRQQPAAPLARPSDPYMLALRGCSCSRLWSDAEGSSRLLPGIERCGCHKVSGLLDGTDKIVAMVQFGLSAATMYPRCSASWPGGSVAWRLEPTAIAWVIIKSVFWSVLASLRGDLCECFIHSDNSPAAGDCCVAAPLPPFVALGLLIM